MSNVVLIAEERARRACLAPDTSRSFAGRSLGWWAYQLASLAAVSGATGLLILWVVP